MSTQPAQVPCRCPWAKSPLAIAYHDVEWGTPLHDETRLFEFLILEGAQAGLSWETILQKRPNYRRAFDQFVPERVARYGQRQRQRLLADAGIVRNRRKIDSAIQNAQALLRLQDELGSLDRFLWSFVDGRPRHNRWRTPSEVPARTAESDALSRELKRRGFSFVGSTICYALMQAVGMVNDHLVRCYRHRELRAAAVA